MADVIDLKTRRDQAQTSRAATCAMVYQRLKFETSNVVFAPIFCVSARKAVADHAVSVKEAS